MMESQRLIKNIATVIALVLAVNIILGIVFVIAQISGIFKDEETDISDNVQITNISNNPTALDIDVSSVNLLIKDGEKFKVETNSRHIKVNSKNNKLTIKENTHSLFKNRVNKNLIIYLPIGYNFNTVNIENGAGKVNFDSLRTKSLNLNLGAGKVYINNLEVFEVARIDTGAGKTVINNASINDLKLNIGVGTVTLNSKLTGNNEIDAGIGLLEINLLGNSNDYKIKVDKGIGNCKIDGNSISDNTFYGDGENIILIDGGVGNINVNYGKKLEESTIFTKTYTVLNKTPSKKENEYYVTLQIFQGEVDTVLITDKDNYLEVDGTYEFTFIRKDKNIQDNIKSIFQNSELVSIKSTDKKGLNQIQDSL